VHEDVEEGTVKRKPDSMKVRSDKIEITVMVGDDEVVFDKEDIGKFIQMAILPASNSEHLSKLLFTCGYASLFREFPKALQEMLKSFQSMDYRFEHLVHICTHVHVCIYM
jgi:hypothetical protein